MYSVIDQGCVFVALGSCCCYHCRVEGGEERVWFTALRASGQCMLSNGIYSMPGMCFVLAFFSSSAFVFVTSSKMYAIKLIIIMVLSGVTAVQQEKGNRKLQEAIRASAALHL